jgi:hypothetical protein
MRSAHRTSGRKPYINPARRGKRGILIPVEPATLEAFKQLAKELNCSIEYLGHKAIALVFASVREPVPKPVLERLEQPAKRRTGRPPKREKHSSQHEKLTPR